MVECESLTQPAVRTNGSYPGQKPNVCGLDVITHKECLGVVYLSRSS